MSWCWTSTPPTDPLHGQQERRFFHGYYDSYCYLPLYVFCGQQLLCALLRPSRIDGAKHAAAMLKLLVRRLRQVLAGRAHHLSSRLGLLPPAPHQLVRAIGRAQSGTAQAQRGEEKIR